MRHNQIDWERWFAWKIPPDKFKCKREPRLRYSTYVKRFNDKLGGIAMVTMDLPKHAAKAKPGALSTSTQQRLWSALDWMSMQYSAGAPVEQIAQVWPYVLRWAEEYAAFHENYHTTPESEGYLTPHVTLRDEEYWIVALRMVCFGLLSGYTPMMPRVMAFLDYGNVEMGVSDGLLERLVAPSSPGRGEPPDEATRHLPYRKLFKVFAADPEHRPQLMSTYLDEWYHASRREPYIDQHGEGDVAFYGYWSWEAAAITVVLDIDDASYRDLPFYPKDWVDFGRLHRETDTSNYSGSIAAGEPAPRDGWWFTPAKAASRRFFKSGEIFPEVKGTDYGSTFWQWDIDQSDSAP
ncbi:conserved hypothetical protein [Cupriavidus taiwanensis]|uniref:PoNe immunity protein domain-containing protein n=1 Tax=Cupriavidus taiwanensis TaxID=164546 RepID=UPI000E16A533|nr:PoNe immunity protein domain-containing protein [Cupriavidus taiwanensis]SOZ20183.1 conserved hypothetical protein [Cupriavidus taiwanensis]SOZ33399.1 conserved hypothetical protein [Cupriavidus taiwanensis]SOZ48712.1 conserved hypothetical protein [Cupriavidus taiwanensis]